MKSYEDCAWSCNVLGRIGRTMKVMVGPLVQPEPVITLRSWSKENWPNTVGEFEFYVLTREEVLYLLSCAAGPIAHPSTLENIVAKELVE